MDFEEFRQRLFLQICDKKDLDLKGENLRIIKLILIVLLLGHIILLCTTLILLIR